MRNKISKESERHRYEVLCTHGHVVYSSTDRIKAASKALDLNSDPRRRKVRKDGTTCAPFHTIALTVRTIVEGDVIASPSLGSVALLGKRMDELLPSE